MKTVRLSLVLCAAAAAGMAQFGGQYPGQQIPGQYPGGGRRNPNGGTQQPQQQSKQTRNSKPPAVTVTTMGMLRATTGTHMVLESDDHRIITYRLASTTTVQKDGKDTSVDKFQPGDRLTVDSSQDDQGYYTATSVKFEKAGTSADRGAALEKWDLPTLAGMPATGSGPEPIRREPGDDRPVLRRAQRDDDPKASTAPTSAQASAPTATASAAPPEEPLDTRPTTQMRPQDTAPDADDPGPPSLRRGVPSARRVAALPPPGTVPSSTGGPMIVGRGSDPVAPPSILTAPSEDPAITKARDVAETFAGNLPNFFCQQVTTRYQSDHPKTGWDALDVVSADLAYEDGTETYKNIKVGNKPVNKRMEDIEGTRSTGEFASLQLSLLSPATGAEFRPNGTDTIHGRSTVVYRFVVPRERSRWRIESVSELYYPSYQGKIWIDKQSSRIVRIEQETKNMPLLFPFDTVETVTDYDFVRLSTSDPILLPVDAEVLSCIRGTSNCTRNRIEFRNYRKFGADTSITFEEAGH